MSGFHRFRVGHAALQSHLVILTGSQAVTASFGMICFFSCLSLPVSFLSLSQYFPGFVNKGLLCNMLLKLAFKSEILVLPAYSQSWLWVYNQKAWSRVIKVKTVNNFVKILSTPFQLFSRSTQTNKNWMQLLPSAVLVEFWITCLLYIQEQTTEYDSAKKRNEVRIHTTTWMNLKNIILSKRSPIQKATCYMIIFIWNVQNIEIYRDRK